MRQSQRQAAQQQKRRCDAFGRPSKPYRADGIEVGQTKGKQIPCEMITGHGKQRDAARLIKPVQSGGVGLFHDPWETVLEEEEARLLA